MQQNPRRKYSAADVKSIVEAYRKGSDLPDDDFIAVRDILLLLERYERMTDEEIEAEGRSAYWEIKP